MLNLPAAKGRAFSSAGTPSRAIQSPEPRRRAGAWPAPGTPTWLSPALPARWARTVLGVAPSCPGCPAALRSRLGYSSGAVGGRV